MKREQSAKAAPWYREPWPWLLMLGPLIVIIAGVITAYLAVVTSDGLVEDDYYKQGLTVNRRTERDQRAAELGVAAEFVLGEEGRRMRSCCVCTPEWPCRMRSACALRIRRARVSIRTWPCVPRAAVSMWARSPPWLVVAGTSASRTTSDSGAWWEIG